MTFFDMGSKNVFPKWWEDLSFFYNERFPRVGHVVYDWPKWLTVPEHYKEVRNDRKSRKVDA